MHGYPGMVLQPSDVTPGWTWDPDGACGSMLSLTNAYNHILNDVGMVDTLDGTSQFSSATERHFNFVQTIYWNKEEEAISNDKDRFNNVHI